MEKLLTKIIESWIIYWDDYLWHWMHEIIASNILESPIWETVVVWVCRWIKEIAEEEWKTLQEVVEDILDEDDDEFIYEN